MPPTISNAAIHEIVAGVKEDLKELKQMLADHDAWERRWREEQVALQGIVGTHGESIAKHEASIKVNHDDITRLTLAVQKMTGQMTLIVWIGGSLGVLIIGLLFSLLTGQATIQFN